MFDVEVILEGIVEKYLDTLTVKASKKFYNTNFQSDMISKKADAYTSD